MNACAAAPNSPDQELRILSPLAGTYYVGVYGSNLPGGSSAFTLSAAETELDIRAVSPNTVANSGRAISRDELLASVWNLSPQGIKTRTIDMHIARLREKLRDNKDKPATLLTVRGKGYRFGWEG